MSEVTNNEFQLVTLGAVKADGTPDIADILFQFPVPHQQMRIKQGVTIDSVKVKGRSGKVKQATGYDDSEIEITMELIDIEDKQGVVTLSAQTQLQQLQRMFRDRSDPVGATNSAVPQVRAVPTIYSIFCPLTESCGIKTVLFEGFETSQGPGETTVMVTMKFIEFEPVPVVAERRGKRKASKTVDAMDEFENRLKLFDTDEEMELRKQWEITTDVREAQGLDAELSLLEGIDQANIAEHQRTIIDAKYLFYTPAAKAENQAFEAEMARLKGDQSATRRTAVQNAIRRDTNRRGAVLDHRARRAAAAKAKGRQPQ